MELCHAIRWLVRNQATRPFVRFIKKRLTLRFLEPEGLITRDDRTDNELGKIDPLTSVATRRDHDDDPDDVTGGDSPRQRPNRSNSSHNRVGVWHTHRVVNNARAYLGVQTLRLVRKAGAVTIIPTTPRRSHVHLPHYLQGVYNLARTSFLAPMAGPFHSRRDTLLIITPMSPGITALWSFRRNVQGLLGRVVLPILTLDMLPTGVVG